MAVAEMSAEDRLGVMDLIANYARCLDRGDVEGWLDNFMPDATLESISGTAVGRDEIRTWVMRLVDGRIVAQDPQRLVHFVGLPLISGTAERCHAETYCLILDYDPQQAIRVPLVGLYVDTCVSTEHGWRFERRIIRGELSVPDRQAVPAAAGR
jgi:hypothetical protein